MEKQELNLECDAFRTMRYLLGEEIRNTVEKMVAKGLSEGSVSVKIKIGTMDTVDENGVIHPVVVFDQKITSKIGSSKEQKCGGSGGRISLGENGKLMIGNDQVTVDELLEEQKGA